MSGRSVTALQVAAEVTRIASMPASPQERAEALLEPLHRVVPYAGAWISLLDPELREQPPLVSHGFADELIRYAQSPACVAEIEQLGLQRLRGAYRHGDLSMNLAEVTSWAEYLAPAGFRGGLSAALFTLDGRYLGMLGLTTDTRTHPTRAACDLISALASTIASAVDPMRLISTAALIIRHAQAAVVLTRAGNTLPVPGLPSHPLLRRGSPVLAVAATILAAHGEYATFLSPYATDDANCEVRVTVLDCAKHPPYYLTGAVVVSAPGSRLGLDRTELEILGLLIEDWSIQRIAAALAIGEGAVWDAVRTIQDKLAAPNLGIATMRALRQGVYIPRALSCAGR
jgi:DNA-binding CsgD family transcriptional regulator